MFPLTPDTPGSTLERQQERVTERIHPLSFIASSASRNGGALATLSRVIPVSSVQNSGVGSIGPLRMPQYNQTRRCAGIESQNVPLMRGATSHSHGNQARMLDSQVTLGFAAYKPLRSKGSFDDSCRKTDE